MVRIKIREYTIEITDGTAVCDNKDIESLAQDTLEVVELFMSYTPFPDYSRALKMIDYVGEGNITGFTNMPKSIADIVY